MVDNGIRHPACPALYYLERISIEAPELVTDIFLELEFENINAISALIGVSKAVDTKNQVKLHKKLIEVAKDPGFGVHAIDFCDVILNLIEKGEPKVAFALARPLIDVAHLNISSSHQPGSLVLSDLGKDCSETPRGPSKEISKVCQFISCSRSTNRKKAILNGTMILTRHLCGDLRLNHIEKQRLLFRV